MKRAVNALQNFGKSLYGPVLILPIVGLFIAFGNVLGNGSLAEYVPFLGYSAVQHLGQLIAKSAVSLLVNLAMIFAVGIPIGLAARDKGYAALLGLVTFIVFINAMNFTLQWQGELAPADQMRTAGQSMVLGVQVLEMGVFAGILTGALTGYLYNRYSGVQFSGAMAIYSGHCFVTIIILPVAIILGVVMSELWPWAQHGISALALAIKGSGRSGWRFTVSSNVFWCQPAYTTWSIPHFCIPNWAVRTRSAATCTRARAISTSLKWPALTSNS